LPFVLTHCRLVFGAKRPDLPPALTDEWRRLLPF